MKCNVGKTDRIIRGIVGLILAIIGIFNLGTWWGIVLLILGPHSYHNRNCRVLCALYPFQDIYL